MKRITYLVAAAALAVGMTAGMSAVASAKQLVYCAEGSPEGFDPGPWTAGTTFDASSRTIYNRLVDFKHGGTDIEPSLAESWDISKDGTEITFHLRHGVKWQTTDYFKPTREFNADDVLFTFDRQRDKSSPWFAYAPGITWQYWDSTGFGAAVKDIVKVDDYTVKFVFNAADSTVFVNFPTDFLSIVSKEYADQLQKAGTMTDLNLKPVGTGPFQFVDYQTDSVIRYKANPDYWAGKQPIDDLVFAITKEPAAAEEALKSGQCDLIPYPIPGDIAALKADPNLTVYETQGLNVGFIAYNTQQKPFDDVRVRKALNMAINKQAIMEGVYAGQGIIAKEPLPPPSWGYDDSIKDDPYDPDAAKKLLADAGQSNLKMKLWWMPVSRPYNPNGKRMGELIQADWKAIGVETELVSMDWAEYLKQTQAVDRDGAVMIGWGADNSDPDNFLGVLLGCAGVGSNNRAQWCYKPYDDLIQQAKGTFDQAERTKLYHQAAEMFKDQAPWATIAHSTQFVASTKRVKNFSQDPLGFHRFDDVDVTD
jgi:dipeptide transport system substrate-binding protein